MNQISIKSNILSSFFVTGLEVLKIEINSQHRHVLILMITSTHLYSESKLITFTHMYYESIFPTLSFHVSKFLSDFLEVSF